MAESVRGVAGVVTAIVSDGPACVYHRWQVTGATQMFPLVLAGCVVVFAIAAYIAVGILVSRARRPCPTCGNKRLKMVNMIRCNPPPNYGFFACESCGGQFVQAARYDGVESLFVPRAGSPWEDS